MLFACVVIRVVVVPLSIDAVVGWRSAAAEVAVVFVMVITCGGGGCCANFGCFPVWEGAQLL